jgi:hypothetical protein
VTRTARGIGRYVLLCASAFVLLLAAIRETPATGAIRGGWPPAAPQAATSFAAQIAALSEPDGYFDTDNLISNERSYLQVVAALRRAGVRGGAYIGVGPDTNFSYVAAVQPTVAFIIDVRRDNLLLHLLFKALFSLASTRVEYLGLLLGRPVPAGVDGWRGAPVERLVSHFDRAAPPADVATLRQRIDAAIKRTGVPLSVEDLATIARFHQRFIDAGLELRFNSAGRAPQSYYPTYRELLLETDADGRQANYLASEEAFQFVRSLQTTDRIIPVVGDLSGPTALVGIGRLLSARRERVSAFYTSNVEFYLYGQGTFARFADNLRHVPHSDRSVIIRSIFGRYTGFGRPGDASTSQLQPVQDLLGGFSEGRFRSYGELVVKR